jgi:hypothetical protein
MGSFSICALLSFIPLRDSFCIESASSSLIQHETGLKKHRIFLMSRSVCSLFTASPISVHFFARNQLSTSRSPSRWSIAWGGHQYALCMSKRLTIFR